MLRSCDRNEDRQKCKRCPGHETQYFISSRVCKTRCCHCNQDQCTLKQSCCRQNIYKWSKYRRHCCNDTVYNALFRLFRRCSIFIQMKDLCCSCVYISYMCSDDYLELTVVFYYGDNTWKFCYFFFCVFWCFL